MKQLCVFRQLIAINDNLKSFASFFNIKWKEGEREQDSGGTESVCARGRALQGEEDSIGNNIDC